jgi:hypothetical protein
MIAISVAVRAIVPIVRLCLCGWRCAICTLLSDAWSPAFSEIESLLPNRTCCALFAPCDNINLRLLLQGMSSGSPTRWLTVTQSAH